MKSVIVREYATLTTAAVASKTLDEAQINESAFEWLCSLNSQFRKNGAELLQIEDQRHLRLDNYVGVIETPCGTRLEILPKIMFSADDEGKSREMLCKMLRTVHRLPVRDAGVANITLFDSSLTEWVMRHFLQALEHLMARGMRSDYIRVEEEQRYLRGQLNMTRQMRQPPGRQHFFQITHDIFTPDRAENRLIKKALERIAQATSDASNWRVARELMGVLAEIPQSKNTGQDFKNWSNDRLMSHYNDIKPWCELVLGQQMPLTQKGEWHGISMLFPMEKLFEKYVAAQLTKQMPLERQLRTGVRKYHLCNHLDKGVFELRPDMLIESLAHPLIVLDAKWKRLTASENNKKHLYGISQSDFYQLFAYGHKYMDGSGTLILIYPKSDFFSKIVEPFHFSDQLTLWVIPFDLIEDQFVDIKNSPLYFLTTDQPSAGQ